MSRKGYNYDFKMMMEGIEVPFNSANIICSPNGVEASLNCHSNEQLLELKPKTSVQLFYKDWFGVEAPGWHLLGDGFLSRFDKNEDASGGVGIAIQIRDFRMDIRKAPAALSYNDSSDISGSTYYHTAGVFSHTTYKVDNGKFKNPTHTFDNSRLNDLADMIVRIARMASGGLAIAKGAIRNTSTGAYYDNMASVLPQANDVEGFLHTNIQGNANGGFFLDAFVRGIWMDASGGTKLGTFLNKRIRSDKRFVVPVNEAGYSFFKVNNLGQLGGEAAMADSQFGSIEAIIMRVAALFMVRVYSCNTPSLISLADDSPAWQFIIDKDVRRFCVKIASKEFGPPYVLNSSMLLPPLEFTAPPDCNLIFPCMYHRVVWQYDMDAEITRGYFTESDCFGTEGSPLSVKWGFQVPNGLFFMPETNKEGKQEKDSSITEYKSNRLTLEERYKGVNVMTGTVEDMVAYRELGTVWKNITLSQASADKLDAEMTKYEQAYNNTKDPEHNEAVIAAKAKLTKANAAAAAEAADLLKKYSENQAKVRKTNNGKPDSNLAKVLKHHALLKFINTKYAGRVITVEMSFNPYLICGFPAIVVADDHGDGIKTLKSMIGMVQQVKHFITRDGEAVSSVVINNVRFIDEPTDMDENGNPLYCKATDPIQAEIDPITLKLKNGAYFVGMNSTNIANNEASAIAEVKSSFVDTTGGIDITVNNNSDLADYKFAKDLLSISKDDVNKGKANGIYLDKIYEPNKISQFYKAVFDQKSNFMVGTGVNSDGKPLSYMFDSIHEAVENIINNKRYLLSDYEQAMSYIKRNVCSEEGFYCGVLGLSFQGESSPGYFTKSGLDPTDPFDSTKSRQEYFGVSSNEYRNMQNQKIKEKNYEYRDVIGNTITKAGMCSSITESSPITALIEERKVAVKTYLNSVLKQVEAVSFINE